MAKKDKIGGYLLYPNEMAELGRLMEELGKGTDREREYGSRLWAVIREARELNEEEVARAWNWS